MESLHDLYIQYLLENSSCDYISKDDKKKLIDDLYQFRKIFDNLSPSSIVESIQEFGVEDNTEASKSIDKLCKLLEILINDISLNHALTYQEYHDKLYDFISKNLKDIACTMACFFIFKPKEGVFNVDMTKNKGNEYSVTYELPDDNFLKYIPLSISNILQVTIRNAPSLEMLEFWENHKLIGKTITVQFYFNEDKTVDSKIKTSDDGVYIKLNNLFSSKLTSFLLYVSTYNNSQLQQIKILRNKFISFLN